MIAKFLTRQIDEIKQSQALRYYGCFLGVTHLLTIMFWHFGFRIQNYIRDPIGICWVFFPSCQAFKPFVGWLFWPTFCVYVVVAVLSTVLWLKPMFTRAAYLCLLVATSLKLVIYFIDYREMGNYHYMPNLVLLVFLFFPHKVTALRFLIVGFYLAAGALKFNHEWLSGAAIFGHPWLEGRALALGCLAVVILETIGSLGLLSRQRWIFWTSLFALAVFHLFSWHIVGYFYPLIMFSLLAVFVLVRHFQSERDTFDVTDFFMGRLGRSTYFVLAIFFLMQLPPFFVRSDSALTGEGRLTSLNMFDARARCHSHLWIRRVENGIPVLIDLENPFYDLGTRIRCEPWVYMSYIRSLCEVERRTDPGFQNIDIDLDSRRSSGLADTVLLQKRNLCAP